MADRDLQYHLQSIKSAIVNANRCLRDKDSSPDSALIKIKKAIECNTVLTYRSLIPADESDDISRSLSALESSLEEEIQTERQESSIRKRFSFQAKTISTGTVEITDWVQ